VPWRFCGGAGLPAASHCTFLYNIFRSSVLPSSSRTTDPAVLMATRSRSARRGPRLLVVVVTAASVVTEANPPLVITRTTGAHVSFIDWRDLDLEGRICLFVTSKAR